MICHAVKPKLSRRLEEQKLRMDLQKIMGQATQLAYRIAHASHPK